MQQEKTGSQCRTLQIPGLAKHQDRNRTQDRRRLPPRPDIGRLQDRHLGQRHPRPARVQSGSRGEHARPRRRIRCRARLPNGATLADIHNRAKELGLELCPAEVGPQLRLQYADQPRGEWLLIAMEPITDSVGDPRIFDVELGDFGRWLDGLCGDPDGFWFGSGRFVFVRRN